MSEYGDTEKGEGIKHCSTPPTHAPSILVGESEFITDTTHEEENISNNP